MIVTIDIRSTLAGNPSGVGTFTQALVTALAPSQNFNYRLFGSGQHLNLPDNLKNLNLAEDFINWPNQLVNPGLKLNFLNLDKIFPKTNLWFLPNLNFISTSKPVVSTYHDLSFEHWPEFFSTKQRLWHAAVQPQHLAQQARALIAVSNYTKTDLIRTWQIPEEKIFVIHPPIDAIYQPQSPNQITAIKNKLNLNQPFVLYLGNVEPRKNVLGLIEAFNLIKNNDLNLVIAGTCGYQSHGVLATIKKSPKSKQIKMLGYVDATDKPALYAAAELFIYPSFFEGFGLPPLEAVACGTPVVASNISALAETSAGFAYGIDPYEITNIKEAVENILGSQNLRQQIISDGQKVVATYRSLNLAVQLEEVFKKVLG